MTHFSRSSKSHRSAFPAIIASAALALATAHTAQASLIIDFRFSSLPGDTHRFISPLDSNTNVPVQVWGTVLGSGELGINFASFRAHSQQIGGGGFVPFLFNTGVNVAAFSPAVHFNNGALAGVAQDISPIDNIFDLGRAPGPQSIALDPRARATLAPASASNAGYYVSQGGWTPVTGGASILLGTYSVDIGVVTPVGTTKFNVGIPTTGGGTWYEGAVALDGASGIKNIANGGFSVSAGTSISFEAAPISYKYALTTHNDATLGTLNSKSLTVLGSSHIYSDPGPASNYTPANGTTADYAIANANLGVGAEVPVLVMVDFDLGSSGKTIAQLESLLTNAGDVAAASIIGPGDADPSNHRSQLLSEYPSFNPATTLLFEFTSAPGATSNGLHFGFDFTNSGISVARTIAIPEPASVTLLALGSLTLLSRRRK